MTSSRAVTRACEGNLGLAESTTADVVRVAIDGATLPEDPTVAEAVHIDRVLGSDIGRSHAGDAAMTARDQKRRMCVVGGLFGFAILALWVRLFQVQHIRHDDCAARRRTNSNVAPGARSRSGARRHLRQGRPAARDERAALLRRGAAAPASGCAPSCRRSPREAGVSPYTVRAAMRGSRPYVYVKHDCMLADETQRELSSAIDGIVIETDAKPHLPVRCCRKQSGRIREPRERGPLRRGAGLRPRAARHTGARDHFCATAATEKPTATTSHVDKAAHRRQHVYPHHRRHCARTSPRPSCTARWTSSAPRAALSPSWMCRRAMCSRWPRAPSIPTRATVPRARTPLWTLHTVLSHVYEPGSIVQAGHCGGAPRQTRFAPARFVRRRKRSR